MMNLTWRNLSFVLASIAALSLPAVAMADDDEKDRKSERDAKEPRDMKEQQKDWKLKTFKLEHRKPMEVARIVALKWRFQAAGPIGIGVIPADTQPRSTQPATGASAPQRPAQPGQPGQPGAQRPGQSRSQPTAVSFRSPERDLVIVALPGEKQLLVRGKDEKINRVEELVKALDVPKGELEKKNFGDLTLLPVRDGKAVKASRYLSLLQIENQSITLGDDTHLLVIRSFGNEDLVKQAREVVKMCEDGEGDE
jgi:hypothetical protein